MPVYRAKLRVDNKMVDTNNFRAVSELGAKGAALKATRKRFPKSQLVEILSIEQITNMDEASRVI